MKIEMKRILLLPALLVNALAAAQYQPDYSSLTDSETVSALKEHVGYIASPSMEGRAPGSDGELQTAAYVTSVLKGYGVDVLSGDEGDVFGMLRPEGDTLTSRNVVGFIRGYDKELSKHYIVIGARMDNLGCNSFTVNGEPTKRIYSGANGNASGLAVLMELSRALVTSSVLLRRSVLLIAFGASTNTFAGSWYFLNRSFPDVDSIDAMINLDVLGACSEGFFAYTSSNKDMNAVLESVNSTLQPVKPVLTSAEPLSSDHMSFYDKEIPSILFSNGRYPEYKTASDTPDIVDYEGMERELEYIFNFSVALAGSPKPMFSVEKKLKSGNASSESVIPYYDCDRQPSFLGSTDPRVFLEKWVYQYLRYPQEAVKEGIQGRVLVDFIIDESGNVTDAKILRSADPLLDDEALRVVNASPTWKPGIYRKEKVKAEISLWIEFRLEKKNKR